MSKNADWRIDHAKRCIRRLEQIRRHIHYLSGMVQKLRPDIAREIHGHSDALKDYREVLEEYIPYEYDVGK